MVNKYRVAPKVTVGTATRKNQQSTGTGSLDLPHLPLGFLIKGHLLPGFRHTLIVVGPLCDSDYAVTFTRDAVIARDKQGTAVLTGWCEARAQALADSPTTRGVKPAQYSQRCQTGYIGGI